MASVNYLTGGEAHSSSQMNSLIGTFDEKLRKILGGKSFFLTPISVTYDGWTGNKFFFGCDSGNAHAVRAGFVSNYDHAPFDSFAQALTVTSYDDANQIANVGVDITTLDGSLAAHHTIKDGESYYFRREETEDFPNDPPASRKPYRPERKHRLAVAEIIIGSGASLYFDSAWDKYNCFRVHNLTSGTVNVNIANDYVLTLKPYECKSVRRSAVGGTYAQTYHYFWPVQADDLRLFTFGSTQPVLSSMVANNVCNPCVVFPFIRAMSDTANAAYFVHDEHENIEPNSADRYGNPDDITTKLADLVFHNGRIDVVTNGIPPTVEAIQYEGINTDFATVGVTKSFSGNTYTLQKTNSDLIGLGTNLFKSGSTAIAAVQINTTFTVDPVVSLTRYFKWPAAIESFSTETFSTPFGNFTGRNYTLAISETRTQELKAFNIGDTVETVLAYVTARAAGVTSYSSSLIFTPFGLALKWTETITPAHSYQSSDSTLQNILLDPRYEFSGGTIVRKSIWFFAGHGFPFYQLRPVEFGNFGDIELNTQTNILPALYCENDRYSGGFAKRGHLMGAKNDVFAPAGGDYEPEPITGTNAAHHVQMTLSRTIESGRFTAFTSPDTLQLYAGASNYSTIRGQLIFPTYQTEYDEGGRVINIPHISNLRTFVALDHNSYNLIAWAVNRLKKGKVLDFGSVTGLAKSLEPAATGRNFWPRNAYAVWTGSEYDALCAQFGITVRSYSEVETFPDYVRKRFEIPAAFSITKQSYDPLINNPFPFPPGAWRVSVAFTGLGSRTLAETTANNSLALNQTKWISVEDVQTVAETLGFTFVFLAVGIPLKYSLHIPDRGGLAIDGRSIQSGVASYPSQQFATVPSSVTYPISVFETPGLTPALLDSEFYWMGSDSRFYHSVDDADSFFARVSVGLDQNLIPDSPIEVLVHEADGATSDQNGPLFGMAGTGAGDVGFNHIRNMGIVLVSSEDTGASLLMVPKDFNLRPKNYFLGNGFGSAGVSSALARIERGNEYSGGIGSPGYNTPASRVVATSNPFSIEPEQGYSILYPSMGSTDEPDGTRANAMLQVFKTPNLIAI